MSVQSEIDRIKNNVTETYSAISEMGGTIPDEQNSNNLADAVKSIPQGATEEELDEIKSYIADLDIKVSQAVISSNDVLDSMYQKPTYTQYITKGNFSIGETENATEKTLSELMGENLPEELSFVINHVTVGTYTSDTLLSDLLNDINENSSDKVIVKYNFDTKDFIFTATVFGTGGKIEMGDGLASAMFDPENIVATSFTEAYGITWLEEGETEKVKFEFPAITTSINVSNDDTIEDIANSLNGTIKTFGLKASYNKYTNQLEVTDENGAKVDFKMTDSYGDPIVFDEDNTPDIGYTPGKDPVFTDIEVNGVKQPIVNKTVNIKVPTKVSQLTNDSKFQTQQQVNTALETKQNILTGTEGQIVGFDSNGNAVAQDAPESVTMQQVNNAIFNAVSNKVSSTSIQTIQTITEAEYNALTTKVSTTLYLIPEG